MKDNGFGGKKRELEEAKKGKGNKKCERECKKWFIEVKKKKEHSKD